MKKKTDTCPSCLGPVKIVSGEDAVAAFWAKEGTNHYVTRRKQPTDERPRFACHICAGVLCEERHPAWAPDHQDVAPVCSLYDRHGGQHRSQRMLPSVEWIVWGEGRALWVRKNPRPGDRWRVLAHRDDDNRSEVQLQDDGEFDELVVGDPCWLHIEQMDTRDWWMQLGEHYVWIHIPSNGTAPVVSVNHVVVPRPAVPDYPWPRKKKRAS